LAKSPYIGHLPPQFDYALLCDHLRAYRGKREKISQMIEEGEIIRVKKGIYTLAPIYRRPYNPFAIANMLYGPSYVSMHSALSHYRAIPEQVAIVTSMNPKRPKKFKTPVGEFQYYFTPPDVYPAGIEICMFGETSVLMATPEKALLDLLTHQKIDPAQVEKAIEGFRIDSDFLAGLDSGRLTMIADLYRHPLAAATLEYWRTHHGE